MKAACALNAAPRWQGKMKRIDGPGRTAALIAGFQFHFAKPIEATELIGWLQPRWQDASGKLVKSLWLQIFILSVNHGRGYDCQIIRLVTLPPARERTQQPGFRQQDRPP